MTSSLVISTYNWPEALELVLKSVSQLKVFPTELVLADDGSTEETKQLIEKYRELLPIPIQHIWQEDKGYRRAAIVNKAIAAAKGEYIIQADGDCILHPYFVADHMALASKNTYLYGSRVNILEEHLETLFKEKDIHFNMLSEGIKNKTRTLRIPLFSRLFFPRDTISRKLRGCNISFFRSDLIKVNGYNEDFEGWGNEDSELARRFHNNSMKAKRIRYRGILFHIYHLAKSKSKLETNSQIEEETAKNKIMRCENGIDKYLEGNA